MFIFIAIFISLSFPLIMLWYVEGSFLIFISISQASNTKMPFTVVLFGEFVLSAVDDDVWILKKHFCLLPSSWQLFQIKNTTEMFFLLCDSFVPLLTTWLMRSRWDSARRVGRSSLDNEQSPRTRTDKTWFVNGKGREKYLRVVCFRALIV